MPLHRPVFLGLDIGSTKICAALCEVDDDGHLTIHGIGTSMTNGLKKGQIIDHYELHRSIERAKKRAEGHQTKGPLGVIANVPPTKMSFIHNMGLVRCRDESGQIQEYEKHDCLRRSKNIIKPVDQTVMHIIPKHFKVDGMMVQNPLGAFGTNLEVNTHIILGDTKSIQDVNKALKLGNHHIYGLVYDVLSSSQILLTHEERREGSILLDFGGQFTKISIFRHNVLHKAAVLPLGGETITNDISSCLNVSVPEAERLKIIYGNADASGIDPQDTISISTQDSRQGIKKELLCQIIQARIDEMLDLIEERISIKHLSNYQIVLGGGGGLLSGLGPYLSNKFGASVREGIPDSIQQVVESPAYASAIGSIIFGTKSGAIPIERYNEATLFAKLGSWLRTKL